MKRLLINLWISRVLCAIVCFANLVIPLRDGVKLNLNIFQLVLIGFWVYGLLSHLGYFKKQVSFDSDEEVIRYETSIPIVQIGFLRIIQFGYFKVFDIDFVLKSFVILIVLDVIYTIFLLLDKAGYYYESEV